MHLNDDAPIPVDALSPKDAMQQRDLNAHALLTRLRPYIDSIVCYASTAGEYAPNRLAVDVETYFSTPFADPVPSDAAAELASAIISLQATVPVGLRGGIEAGIFRCGFRDAKHAAAELVAEFTCQHGPLRRKLLPLSEHIEAIAREWDGRQYDTPGQAIDIGAAIRRRGASIANNTEQQE